MNINETASNITTIQSSHQVRDEKAKFSMEQQTKKHGEQDNKAVSKEEMRSTVDTLNEFLKPARHSLQFELHEELEKYYVSVVNPETDEIIREIPPKKMLDMYAKMAEYMGLLVDEKI